jgi:cytochrome b pre-mRNA-processing protein 3
MFTLFRADPLQRAAHRAYEQVVAQARQTVFFAEVGVPDTVAGRFELLCLHAFLYLHRLKREQPPAKKLSQLFFDAMFLDLDRSLREMGTGDLSVGREVRRMAEAFYGRIAAYEGGLADGEAALQAALARNLFGTAPATAAPRLSAMAAYLHGEVARLDAQHPTALLAGEVAFGGPPQAVGAAEAQ